MNRVSCRQINILLQYQANTLWLTQRQIAELFDKTPPTINEHLKNIYEEGELEPAATIRKFRIVAREGARDVERLLDHYNLDAVMAVGYSVDETGVCSFEGGQARFLKSI